MRFMRLFVLFVAVFAIATPQTSAASDCSQLVGKMQKDLQEFQQQAEKMKVDFLVEDVGIDKASVIEKAKEVMDDQDIPAWERYRALEAGYGITKEIVEETGRWNRDLNRCLKCLGNIDRCSIKDLIRESEVLNKKLAEWLKSLTPGEIKQATDRVKKASKLVHNYSEKITASSTGSATAAASCLADRSRQARTEASNQGPVALGDPKKPIDGNHSNQGSGKPKKGGSSMSGTIIPALVTAAALGGAYAIKAAREADGEDSSKGCPKTSAETGLACWSRDVRDGIGVQSFGVDVVIGCGCPSDTYDSGVVDRVKVGGPYRRCLCLGNGNSALEGNYMIHTAIAGTMYLEVSRYSVRLSSPGTQGGPWIGNIDGDGNFAISGTIGTLSGGIRDGTVTGTHTLNGYPGSTTISGSRQ